MEYILPWSSSCLQYPEPWTQETDDWSYFSVQDCPQTCLPRVWVFFVLNTNNRTRGHNFKFCLPRCNSKKRLNFFAIRIIPAWNSLPVESVNAVSVNSFKKRSLHSINFAPFLSREHTRGLWTTGSKYTTHQFYLCFYLMLVLGSLILLFVFIAMIILYCVGESGYP